MEDLLKAIEIFKEYGICEVSPFHCERHKLYVCGVEYDSVGDIDKDILEGLGFVKDDIDEDGFMKFMSC